jgi:putative transposase
MIKDPAFMQFFFCLFTLIFTKNKCMGFSDHSFYHVFNRGINKQKIFFNQNNYEFFLDKIERHIVPYCDIISYCLMPNHFHLLISTNEQATYLSKALQVTLSSYTRAINIQENRTGSLFQQNTKRKYIHTNDDGRYLSSVFKYIHQNPIDAKLVLSPEDWQYSSYNEYFDLKPLHRYICDINTAKLYIELSSAEMVLI